MNQQNLNPELNMWYKIIDYHNLPFARKCETESLTIPAAYWSESVY